MHWSAEQAAGCRFEEILPSLELEFSDDPARDTLLARSAYYELIVWLAGLHPDGNIIVDATGHYIVQNDESSSNGDELVIYELGSDLYTSIDVGEFLTDFTDDTLISIMSGEKRSFTIVKSLEEFDALE